MGENYGIIEDRGEGVYVSSFSAITTTTTVALEILESLLGPVFLLPPFLQFMYRSGTSGQTSSLGRVVW